MESHLMVFHYPLFYKSHPSRKLRFPAFYFSSSAPEIHTGVPDERGFVEAIFQGCAFLRQEPTIFEMER